MIRSACVLSLTLAGTGVAVGRSDRVLLRDVSALTLRRGEYTTHRRVSPVSQLSCTRGCNSANTPDEIQCVNVGFDGVDVNWKCEADLPMGAKLTHMNIQCEGYDNPDDPYILAGSCGASFELEQSRYAYAADEDRHRSYAPRSIHYDPNQGEWSWSSIIMLLFVGFIFWNVFCGSSSSSSTSPHPSTSSYSRPSGGGWGNGWGSGWGNGWGGGGGFFSGLGLGSMLGSMWSRPRRTGWGGGGGGWWGQPSSYYGGSSQHHSNYSGGGYGFGRGATAPSTASSSRGERRTTSSYATTTRR